jgi:hypothetical protein
LGEEIPLKRKREREKCYLHSSLYLKREILSKSEIKNQKFEN